MKVSVVITFLLVLPASSWAGETAAFLKLGVGARSLGMGGTYTAITDDVTALSWNPAGLSGLSKRELGAMHAELTTQTRYDFLGYAQPTKSGAFGAGAAYLSHGSIEGRDASGKPTGGFSASDAAVNFGYARKLGYSSRLGISVKFIKSSIADASAQTFAVDIGGMWELAQRGPGVPQIGLAVQNLGPGLKFAQEVNPLPLTLALGMGYRLPAGLVLAADFRHRPYSRDSEIGIGTEYAVFSGLALRTGYGLSRAVPNASSGVSAPGGFAAGFGVKVFGYALDYSMTPFGELGSVQRFSLGARF